MKVTCFACKKTFDKKPSEVPKSGKNYCSRKCLFDLNVRFWNRVDAIADGCWNISGAHTQFGYGLIGHRLAHRFSWVLHNGPIPDGLWVLHRCDNPKCVNPAHLFLGTPQDNQLDASAKGRLPRGECNHKAKLSESQVREIRTRHSLGERGRDLAKEFHVTEHCVSCVINKKTWKFLDLDYVPRSRIPRDHKLSTEQAYEVRYIYALGMTTQQQLANRFGVSQTTVSKIIHGYY